MEKGAKTRVVPVVSDKSTFAELTQLVFYSFVEEDRELVEKILANREKGLVDELDKLKRKCDSLEKERNGLEKTLDFEMGKSRESEILMKKKLTSVVKEKLKVEEVFEKYRNETEEKMRETEEKMKETAENGFENILQYELKKSRENYEKEFKREMDLIEKKLFLVNLEKLRVEDEFGKFRSEIEEKFRGYNDALEKVRNGFDERLKLDFEKSNKKIEEELIRERELMKQKLSVVLVEKLKVENEFEKYRKNVEEKWRIVAKSDVTQKSLNLEEGKSRESYGMTLKRERDAIENKLSLALLEKGKVEDEFKRYRTELGDMFTILERQYGELKREIELRKEGDHEQVEKTLANQEKGLMYEAERRLTEFKDRVEFLGRENGELLREIGLHEDSACKRLKLEEKEVDSKCSETGTIGVQSGVEQKLLNI